MRLCWEMGGWIPAWVVVRAILATGLEAALRDATPARLQGLRYLVDAWCYRIFRPQLDLAVQSQGHPPLRSTRGNDTVRRLVASWLTLRFAPDVRRRAIAREFPAAAEMAKGTQAADRGIARLLRPGAGTGTSWTPRRRRSTARNRRTWRLGRAEKDPGDDPLSVEGRCHIKTCSMIGTPLAHASRVWLHDFHPANGLMEQLYIEFHGRELSTPLHSPAPFRS